MLPPTTMGVADHDEVVEVGPGPLQHGQQARPAEGEHLHHQPGAVARQKTVERNARRQGHGERDRIDADRRLPPGGQRHGSHDHGGAGAAGGERDERAGDDPLAHGSQDAGAQDGGHVAPGGGHQGDHGPAVQSHLVHEPVGQERDRVHVAGIFEQAEKEVECQHVRDPDRQGRIDPGVKAPQERPGDRAVAQAAREWASG